MFDVGFWELLIIAVIGLLVIGPERLPGAARTVGAWVGKARRVFQSVKEEVEHELQTEDLQRSMREQIDIPDLDRKLLDDDATRQRRRGSNRYAPDSEDQASPSDDAAEGDETQPGVSDERDAEARDSTDDRAK